MTCNGYKNEPNGLLTGIGVDIKIPDTFTSLKKIRTLPDPEEYLFELDNDSGKHFHLPRRLGGNDSRAFPDMRVLAFLSNDIKFYEGAFSLPRN